MSQDKGRSSSAIIGSYLHEMLHTILNNKSLMRPYMTELICDLKLSKYACPDILLLFIV